MHLKLCWAERRWFLFHCQCLYFYFSFLATKWCTTVWVYTWVCFFLILGILYQSTLSLISGDQVAESSVKAKCCDGSQNNPKGIIERIYPLGAAIGKPKSSTEGISPAKIAQSEWKSLTESDNSSESTANTMRNFEQTMQTNIMWWNKNLRCHRKPWIWAKQSWPLHLVSLLKSWVIWFDLQRPRRDPPPMLLQTTEVSKLAVSQKVSVKPSSCAWSKFFISNASGW